MTLTRVIRLFIGLILYALGVVFTIQANLGLSPWDALHSGLSQRCPLTFGEVSILVGFVVIMITFQFHEPVGVGSILNAVLVGLFIDLIQNLNLIALSNSFSTGVVMLFSGMFLVAMASYFYIGSRYGAGPRDGLMVALTRETGMPVGLIRAIIEMTVLFMGYLLGAKIGIGTVLLAFGMGPMIQIIFQYFHFNVRDIEHDSILQKKTA